MHARKMHNPPGGSRALYPLHAIPKILSSNELPTVRLFRVVLDASNEAGACTRGTTLHDNTAVTSSCDASRQRGSNVESRLVTTRRRRRLAAARHAALSSF